MSLGSILAMPFRTVQQVAQELADALDDRAIVRPPVRTRRSAGLVPPRQASRAEKREQLLGNLDHRSASVRARSALELGLAGYFETSHRLTVLTRESRRPVRQAALGALLLLDPEQFAEATVTLAEKIPRTQLFADLDAMMETVVRSVRARSRG